MKQILWFCRTSDSSSLSRITDSVLPLLSKDFEITLLGNKTELTCVKNIIIGSDCKSITYHEFINSQHKQDQQNIRFLNMKYIIVQIVDLVYEGDYEYVFICNGVYEIDWITKILKSNPNNLVNKHGHTTKLVVWSPIDYIPTKEVVQNVIKADKFITMTPVMKDEILSLFPNSLCEIDWVGHGSDIVVNNNEAKVLTKQQIIERLVNLKTPIHCKNSIKESDIIILNANNYGPLDHSLDSVQNTPGTRKRLDITVRAFLAVLEKNKNVKLWIHTNLKSFFQMLAIEGILINTFIDNIILTNNNVSNEELSLIYQLSDISLQTSTGEGWSLTNLESALYNSLQVVPDFLACGHHFKNRGILIPVTRKIIKNEGNLDVIIGEVSIDDTTEALNKAIEVLEDKVQLDKILNDARNYSKEYTWKSISDKLLSILN